MSEPDTEGRSERPDRGSEQERGRNLDDTVLPDATDRPSSVDPFGVAPGALIGPYKLLRAISEGGMGKVWLAERRDTFQQRVALKFAKFTGADPSETIARFEQEREVLAALSHEHIAKIFDGGIHMDRPWFAMEYVDGLPINEFCDRKSLSLRERLVLFRQVCDAVTHAHRRGILHRDLKPTNILVTLGTGREPQAKVIDFGIAKAMAQRLTDRTITREHRAIGTFEYMSPEQADPRGMDLDTRTDVYSLGVVLYELLAGVKPFDLERRAEIEAHRIIREDDPPTPSVRLSTIATRDSSAAQRISRGRRDEIESLVGALRRELEWIPLMAIRKDRERRYGSAEDLSRDIQNYLEGRPLVAVPESSWYRARKYLGRHRRLVTAAAVALSSLVTGLGVATWQWHEAVAAREAETERAEQLKRLAEFQSQMLIGIDTTTAGVELMRDMQDRFAAALGKAGVPEAERLARVGALRRELASVNATDAARAMIDRTILQPAIRAIDSEFGSDPRTGAGLRQAVALVYVSIGLYPAALPLQESALATRRRVLGDEHPDTLTSINNMGYLLQAMGKHAEAEPHYREALDARRRVLGGDHPDTLTSINNMGYLLQARGKYTEAEPHYREALERRRRVLGDDHPDTLVSINNMGLLLQVDGRLAESEPYRRETLERRRRVLGDDHPSTIIAISGVGVLLENQGKYAEAEPYYREALERFRRVQGEDHPNTLTALNNMGFLLDSQGRYAEAEPHYREALEKRRRIMGDDHPRTITSINNMGALLHAQGRLAEAEPYLREALERCRRVHGEEHPDTITVTARCVHLMLDQGRPEQAIGLVTPRTEAAARERFRGGGPRLGTFLAALGRARSVVGRDAESLRLAEATLLEAHGILMRAEGRGPEHRDTLDCVQALADLYRTWDAAEPGSGYSAKAQEWGSRLDGAKRDPA